MELILWYASIVQVWESSGTHKKKCGATVVRYVSCDKAESLCLEAFVSANCSNIFSSLPDLLHADIVICADVSRFFCSDTSFPVEEQMCDQMASSGALPLHSAIDSSRRTGLIKSHCLVPSSNHRETGTDGSVPSNTRISNCMPRRCGSQCRGKEQLMSHRLPQTKFYLCWNNASYPPLD